MVALAQAHLDELAKLNKAHHAEVTQLNAAFEALRIEKDEEIARLHASMEEQRSKYEL